MEAQLRTFLRSQIPQATEITVSALQRRPSGASRESWAFDVAWKESGTEVRPARHSGRGPQVVTED